MDQTWIVDYGLDYELCQCWIKDKFSFILFKDFSLRGTREALTDFQSCWSGLAVSTCVVSLIPRKSHTCWPQLFWAERLRPFVV